MTAPVLDHDVLSAIFACRLALARKTEEEAVEEARILHGRAIAWLRSDSQKVHSFRWFCDVLDQDAGVVRKALKISYKEEVNEDYD